MTKDPVPGAVKTRLIPAIGAEMAAALHAAMVAETLRIAGETGLAVEIRLSGELDGPFAAGLRRQGCKVLDQGGGDLGQRLVRALAGPGGAFAIGTDSPTVRPEWIVDAAAREEPVVLGPSEDGGYWLVGVRGDHPGLFADIAWSTDRVLAQTLMRAEALGLTVGFAPEAYDIDVPDDLRRLSGDPECPGALQGWIDANITGL